MSEQFVTLSKAIRLLAAATVALFVLSLLIGILGYISNSHRLDETETLARANAETRLALCSFTSDLQRRYDQSKRILEENPELLNQFNLTPAEVELQLRNQKATLDSLSDLDCP